MATNATKTRPQQQQEPQRRGSNGQTNRPFQVIRRGSLKVVIWENQTTNGPMFSTQLIRVYKDGDDWKETHSLNRDDLLHASKMLDQVDTIVYREEEKRRQQQDPGEGDQSPQA
jgi:hypothetical protein